MSETPRSVVVAFPRDDEARAKLRKMAGLPLPVIVPNSTDVPCVKCGIVLAVGPLSMAALVVGASGPYCPPCTARLPGRKSLEILSLGNPNSKPEPAE